MLRYLHGTIGYGLRYTFVLGVRLFGYTDLDWVSSVVDQKSTLGYCFSMGSVMISLSSRKKSYVASSIAEEEYISVSDVGKGAIWLRKLLVRLFGDVLDTTIIQFDN